MVSGLVSALSGMKLHFEPLKSHRLHAFAMCPVSVVSIKFLSQKLQSEFFVSCVYPRTAYACQMIFAASCLVRKSFGL